MNYIQLINSFWAKAESDNLKGNDISVYFALLKYCNKLNWLNPFVCHWDILCQYAKVSKNSYYNSIETLSSKGYIKYQKGKKNQLKPKVFILEFENREGTIKEQNEEQNEEQKGNLYKLLNTKTIKLINNNASLVNYNLEKWIISEVKDENKEKPFNFLSSLLEIGVEKQVAKDYMEVRKKKKGANTKTALDGLVKEIKKSNKTPNECIKLCAERSWVGFKSEWMKEDSNEPQGIWAKKDKS